MAGRLTELTFVRSVLRLRLPEVHGDCASRVQGNRCKSRANSSSHQTAAATSPLGCFFVPALAGGRHQDVCWKQRLHSRIGIVVRTVMRAGRPRKCPTNCCSTQPSPGGLLVRGVPRRRYSAIPAKSMTRCLECASPKSLWVHKYGTIVRVMAPQASCSKGSWKSDWRSLHTSQRQTDLISARPPISGSIHVVVGDG